MALFQFSFSTSTWEKKAAIKAPGKQVPYACNYDLCMLDPRTLVCILQHGVYLYNLETEKVTHVKQLDNQYPKSGYSVAAWERECALVITGGRDVHYDAVSQIKVVKFNRDAMVWRCMQENMFNMYLKNNLCNVEIRFKEG